MPDLDDERLCGGAPADDGLRSHVSLCTPLVVQHGASDGGGAGKLNYPVAIEVVLPSQVLNG